MVGISYNKLWEVPAGSGRKDHFFLEGECLIMEGHEWWLESVASGDVTLFYSSQKSGKRGILGGKGVFETIQGQKEEVCNSGIC